MSEEPYEITTGTAVEEDRFAEWVSTGNSKFRACGDCRTVDIDDMGFQAWAPQTWKRMRSEPVGTVFRFRRDGPVEVVRPDGTNYTFVMPPGERSLRKTQRQRAFYSQDPNVNYVIIAIVAFAAGYLVHALMNPRPRL